MKNLFTILFLLAFVCCATNLNAQTYKQKVRSAQLLNKIMPPSLKITPDMIHKVTQKDLRADIEAAGYSKEIEAALLAQTMPVKIIDWRAIAVEFSEECNARLYIYGISIDGEVESLPSVYFAPGNKCESLYLRLAEAGLVDPFWTAGATDDDYSVCVSTSCIANDSSSCCFNVAYKVPAGKECPQAECTVKSCDCEVKLSDGYWADIYMEK